MTYHKVERETSKREKEAFLKPNIQKLLELAKRFVNGKACVACPRRQTEVGPLG